MRQSSGEAAIYLGVRDSIVHRVPVVETGGYKGVNESFCAGAVEKMTYLYNAINSK